MANISDLILKYALANAFSHNGKANEGAVLGKLIAEQPELKTDIENLRSEIKKVIEKINKLSLKTQEARLHKIWPEFFVKEKKEEKKELPELPNAVEGKVVTRLPPEPNGYMHIGHAISFFFNYYYAKKYNGKLVLRFEDTNPEAEELQYYKAIKEDIDWLGIKYDTVKNNSDDMPLFYECAEKLIKQGNAYVCTCDVEKMRKNRFEGNECEHRNFIPEVNLNLWKRMLSWAGCERTLHPASETEDSVLCFVSRMMQKGFKEGAAVLRLKADLKSNNTVMRDPVLFRIVKASHPLQKKKYRVWPLYDFANAIEDAICGVTHVLRSAEFMQRNELQNRIRTLLGYKNPEIISYSRINFASSPTSKRKILELLDKKIIENWDDPRLVTISALRERGFLPEAIYNMALNVRMSLSSTTIDWDMLAAENRKLLDKKAKRYFFVPEPIKLEVSGATEKTAVLKFHPTLAEFGSREIKTAKTFFIPKGDVEKLRVGDIFRLKDLYSVKINSIDSKIVRASFIGDEMAERAPKLQWVIEKSVPAEILSPDQLVDKDENPLPNSLQVISGLCEEECKKIKKDEVVQFERFGFVKIRKASAEKIEGILTNK